MVFERRVIKVDIRMQINIRCQHTGFPKQSESAVVAEKMIFQAVGAIRYLV